MRTLYTASLALDCMCRVSGSSKAKLLSLPETRFLESTYIVTIDCFFLLMRKGVLEISLAVDPSDTPRRSHPVGIVPSRGSCTLGGWLLLQHLMLLHSDSMMGPPPSNLLAAADRKPPIVYRLRVLPVQNKSILPALVEHVRPVLEVVDEPEAVL